ncbi:flagellar motor switch protein FliM [Syntrophobotulus glycolicus DSM 8271]|uniref:Flagellar motor switch protein FliM n=1 Tax=Syntrophobotulus glycolicus (strain DSM 8271 / FlGlyR) TaxID=645991 RepID=F0SZG0_SYNGF|nr:flagellar motor switch protein FliM [Syntrophobotulus glycolicus]ADY54965.1 flagellar motor switch protein FliM [Syntrophobotulus glycolicus DSM 8271]
MAEVLSQSEIDALLNALSDGSVDEEAIALSNSHKVRLYDFKRPNKFSKGQLNSLRNIHENFCRNLVTYLAGAMHTVIEAKVLSTEQVTYDEYTRSLPYPSILGIYSMDPLEGNALIELSPGLGFHMVDRLLGGYGKDAMKNRDLTEIERRIVQGMLRKMISVIGEAWSEIYTITPQYVDMETNVQFIQIVAPNEMVVVVTMEVKIEDSIGMINICLPYIVMKPILDKLNNILLFSSAGKAQNPEDQRTIRRKIERVRVPLKVFLGQTQITVRELLGLEKGDVIPLQQHIQEPLDIYVGKFKKFAGIPGLHSNRLAVQISGVLNEEGGDNDGE